MTPSSSLAGLSLLALGLGVAQAGCSSDRSICGEDEVCPTLAADALAGDARLTWDPASTLNARLRNETATPRVVGGGAVFTPTVNNCSAECEYTLKSLYFELERMSYVLDGGLSVDELRIGLDPETSVPLSDAGGDLVLPAGTKTLGCAKVNGEPLATQTELGTDATLVIDLERESFRFDGELRFEFRAVPNRECTDYSLTLSGEVGADTPWTQRPATD